MKRKRIKSCVSKLSTCEFHCAGLPFVLTCTFTCYPSINYFLKICPFLPQPYLGLHILLLNATPSLHLVRKPQLQKDQQGSSLHEAILDGVILILLFYILWFQLLIYHDIFACINVLC